MAAIFTSNIEENGIGGWRIRLTDTVDGREELCGSMEEFVQKIEELGADYGGDIEVKWSKDDNVTPEHFAQVQQAISKYDMQEKSEKDEF